MKGRRRGERAFSLARGVRILGTNITCDALGGRRELGFLSHAQALGRRVAGGRSRLSAAAGAGRAGRGRWGVAGAGRHELLATEATLALLGPAGARLRRHALPAGSGAPSPSARRGWSCSRRGTCPGRPRCWSRWAAAGWSTPGRCAPRRPPSAPPRPSCAPPMPCASTAPSAIRASSLPPPAEALARLLAFVEEALAAGRAPVLLTPPFGTAMDAAAALAAAGFALRGHRAIVAAAAAFRAAGASPAADRPLRRAARRRTRRCCGRPRRTAAALLGKLASPAAGLRLGLQPRPRGAGRRARRGGHPAVQPERLPAAAGLHRGQRRPGGGGLPRPRRGSSPPACATGASTPTRWARRARWSCSAADLRSSIANPAEPRSFLVDPVLRAPP